MKIDPNRPQHAIYSHNRCGPTFGNGLVIHIVNNANTTWDSYTDLGKSYTCIPNIHIKQLKLKYFWVDQGIFNWMKLKFIKKKKNKFFYFILKIKFCL
jgi:hypothetical protein